MEKRTLYPKTTRLGNAKREIVLTEKVDGSNLGFYVLDGELFIAQRNWIFILSEIELVKRDLYKGLYQFLVDNGEALKSLIMPGSIVFGEWIGMGKLKYNFDNRFLMFAKGRFDADGNVFKLVYDLELLKYAFVSQEIPDFIGVVPLAATLLTAPNINVLDSLYIEYTAEVGRPVEGFVINNNNVVTKYVRMKNGTLTPHKS